MKNLAKPNSKEVSYLKVKLYDAEKPGKTCENKTCAGGAGDNCTNRTCSR